MSNILVSKCGFTGNHCLTVTGNHAHKDARLVTVGHRLDYIISQRVFNANNSNEGKALFLRIYCLGIVLALFELTIGQCKSTQSCKTLA
jgi:hypothetical protein